MAMALVSRTASPTWGGGGGGEVGGAGFAEHGAHDDGPVDVVSDLRMAADEGDPDVSAGVGDLAEGVFDPGLGHVLGDEERGEEPAGLGARGRDVIGVDVDGVPADFVGGEGYGVGLGNEDAVVGHGDYGGVLADAGADEYPGVGGRGGGEELVEEVGGELANLHWGDDNTGGGDGPDPTA